MPFVSITTKPSKSLKIFFMIFVLIGTGASIFGLNTVVNAVTSGGWPTTAGTIVSSEVETTGAHSDETSTTMYHAAVLYQYSIDNTLYSGNAVSFGQYDSSDPNHAQQIVNKYPAGSVVSVYYNPNSPSISVLEPGTSWNSFAMLVIGLLVLGIGISGVVWATKSKSKEVPAASVDKHGPAQKTDLEEMHVESFWGAIASLVWVQIFGVVVYNGFLFHASSGSTFQVLWGGALVFVFLVIQAGIMGKINKFRQSSGLEKPSFEQPLEFSKFILASIFAVIFVLFLVDYPFPKVESSIFLEIAFFLLSWIASGGLNLVRQSTQGEKIYADKGVNLIFPLAGALFFGVGIWLPQLFYFFGMLGLGVATVSIVWILCERREYR